MTHSNLLFLGDLLQHMKQVQLVSWHVHTCRLTYNTNTLLDVAVSMVATGRQVSGPLCVKQPSMLSS
jgi:hypothetical protein